MPSRLRWPMSSLRPAATRWSPTWPALTPSARRNRRTPAAWPSSRATLRLSPRAITSSAAPLRPTRPIPPPGPHLWPPAPVAPETTKRCWGWALHAVFVPRGGTDEQPPVPVRLADGAGQDPPQAGGPARHGALVEFVEVE